MLRAFERIFFVPLNAKKLGNAYDYRYASDWQSAFCTLLYVCVLIVS